MAPNPQVSAPRKPLRSRAPMTTPLRGVSVLRLSVLTDETTSPERQRAANYAAASSLGIDLADREAVDLGVSASKTTPFQRPELGAWLRRPDDFDALFFWRFDRAVRSMADMDELVKWAKEHKKMIVFAEGPGGQLRLDFRNGVDIITELILKIFAFAAEFEANSIKERVISAQAAMRVMPLRWKGSRPPYGYMPAPLEGGGFTLTQDPDCVSIIERIVRELQAGKSAAAIATGLNAAGIPSPRDHWSLRQGRTTGGKTGGKKGETVTRERFAWRHNAIKELMTSERLLGWKVTGGNPVRDSVGEPIMATAEPILTRAEFDAIGALFAGRAVANKHADRVDTTALLLRVILCDECGERMYLHRPSAKSTSNTETYKCGANTRGKPCESKATIKRQWADDYAERKFLRMLGALEITQTRTVPGYDPGPEIETTLAEFEAHQEQQGRQRSSVAKAAWQRHADALDARLAELESRECVPTRTETTGTGVTYADRWKGANTAQRRRMLVDAGAVLRVQRGKRGKHWVLDESRVAFDVTAPFFADAADAMADIELEEQMIP
ncbi:recombinase family protein [Streptomyces sp. NPDC001876]|uniref:recombinase family protein n=1 Tax=Streptomyces sp. NPDC001876 TaxID=3154402 RepID=UPI003332D2EF